MNRIRKLQAGLLPLLIAVPGWAGSGNLAQDVVSVSMHDTGHAVIVLAGSANSENCATSGHERSVAIERSDSRFKYMYATALAAAVSNKKLNAWVDGCVDMWGDGRMKIVRLVTLSVER